MMLKVMKTNLTHFFNHPPGEILRRVPVPGSFGGVVMTGALVMDTTVVAGGRSGCGSEDILTASREVYGDTENFEIVVSIGNQ
ncbi:hypothetical protein BOTCAL_0308g00040 [Botryotinia calthae]|uniref:Uncharacterized protein n=1 Tax=Botryotinia calthae TaxID=38488 RepID=A0A4Y8CU25_9HELO|nr:hypothetical protein BOTCAL_0308g00040 [Botryotinia calthae]